MTEIINKHTGEVMRYRTSFNAGNFCDNTEIKGESMTDVTEFETVQDTINRCMRGKLIRDIASQFEFRDDERAHNFDNYDITQEPGFDLVDGVNAVNEINERLKKSNSGAEPKNEVNEADAKNSANESVTK